MSDQIKKKRPLGVLVFAIILIVTSINQINLIAGYSFYAQVNHEWPEGIIKIRYIVSYLLRISGLVAGLGILLLNNSFRNFLIGLSIFSFFTLPLRHTYKGMFYFTEPIYRQYGSMFSVETFTWIAVGCCWFIDGLFALAVIYYFTRPAVKACFTKQEK